MFLRFVATFVFAAFLLGCKPASAPQNGQMAPSISCNDIKGDYFSLSQVKGKPCVIYFWSSKCCSEYLKQLEPLYQDMKPAGGSIVAIEVGGAKEAVATFVKDSGLTFTNLTDDGTFSRAYRVIGYPSIFLVDSKGIVAKKISGEIPIEELKRQIAAIH